jgi:hypothetical protein
VVAALVVVGTLAGGDDVSGSNVTCRDVPAIPDDATEAVPLAQAITAAYQRMARFYRDQYGLTGPEADARARGGRLRR